jgi:ubiquinone/menaquinone biosynthesis C-methylase UbiE
MKPAAEFDSFAVTYDADIDQALLISGETKDYFAQARVDWLAKRLRNLAEPPRSVIDYGCGIGGTAVLLRDTLGAASVVGLDISASSLNVARSRFASQGLRFLGFEEYSPREEVEVVYCNGVFHHIPPAERSAAAGYILRCLQPGGLFALWENNPWNPGTRYIMSQCAFDHDAITLTPPEAVELLRAAGFQVLHTDFLFIFPRVLKFLRFLEPGLSRLPLGAQYMVLCRKPGRP